MPANPSEPKKFDAVTILGLAVAVAILVLGQMHMAKKHAQEVADAQRVQEEQNESLRIKAAQDKTKLAEQGDGKTEHPNSVEAPKKAVETPDIAVTAKYLDLVFCAKGGALKHARLVGVDEDAAKKDGKGLDILAEIVPGKRTFGIPQFEVNPPNGKNVILDGKPVESLDDSIWTPKDSGSFDANGIRILAYEFVLPEYTLTKTFTVSQNERFIRCDLKIENRSEQDVKLRYVIYGPQGILLDGPAQDPKGGAGSRVTIQGHIAAREAGSQGQSNAEPEVLQVNPEAAKKSEDDGRSLARNENLWASVKNRFFMAALVSLDPNQLVKLKALPIQNNDVSTDKRFEEPNIGLAGDRRDLVLNKSTVRTDSYALYLGPADDDHLNVTEAVLKPLMSPPSDYHLNMSIQFFDSFNWRWPRVDWLARQMMWVFKGLHHLFGNFGIAVVLMTILIKLCLHPLQRKMMVSMSKMQKLQPELNKIKEKYKNATSNEAKMKMTMEQQDVMKKAGVNPAAGCLPMFVQIPVFSALYGIFNHAFDMRGAEFLWIKDLSQPDHLYSMPGLAHVSSWLPTSINLLPILYIVLSVVQTRMQPQQQKSDDPQQEMNRKMMMFMPVFISLMFYSMPAGLVLYFAVSACWGMLESWYIKKFLIKDSGTSQPPAGTAKMTAQLAR